METTYGQQLRTLRKERSLSQEQLAQMARIAINSLRRYESDERSPTMDVIKRLAKALDVPSSILLGDVDPNTYERFEGLAKRRALSHAFAHFCEACGFSDWSEGNQGEGWIVADPDGKRCTLSVEQYIQYKKNMQEGTMDYLRFLHQQSIKKVLSGEI